MFKLHQILRLVTAYVLFYLTGARIYGAYIGLMKSIGLRNQRSGAGREHCCSPGLESVCISVKRNNSFSIVRALLRCYPSNSGRSATTAATAAAAAAADFQAIRRSLNRRSAVASHRLRPPTSINSLVHGHFRRFTPLIGRECRAHTPTERHLAKDDVVTEVASFVRAVCDYLSIAVRCRLSTLNRQSRVILDYCKTLPTTAKHLSVFIVYDNYLALDVVVMDTMTSL